MAMLSAIAVVTSRRLIPAAMLTVPRPPRAMAIAHTKTDRTAHYSLATGASSGSAMCRWSRCTPPGAVRTGRLDGRIAIVTGASSGIGRACAVHFAAEGASVVGCARRADKFNALMHDVEANGGQAIAVACDVGSGDDIDNVVQSPPSISAGVDILANIAQGGMHELADIMGRRRTALSTRSPRGRCRACCSCRNAFHL